MSDPTILVRRLSPLPKLPTYLGECCRVWVLAVGIPVGSCGLCGERPTYLGPDE